MQQGYPSSSRANKRTAASAIDVGDTDSVEEIYSEVVGANIQTGHVRRVVVLVCDVEGAKLQARLRWLVP